MKSDLPKVLQPICGAPMLEFVLDAVAALQPLPAPTVVLVGHQAERMRSAVGTEIAVPLPVEVVVQEPQLGTGHAMQVAAPCFEAVAKAGGDILVLLGDVPLIRPATIARLVAKHREERASATMLTMRVPDPTGYGRVLRDSAGRVRGVVEHKDATVAEREIDEVNTGMFVFAAADLLPMLEKLRNDNKAGEYYLPDVIPMLVAKDRVCAALVADDPDDVRGINTFKQLAEADRTMRQRILDAHMENGVHIVDPASAFIDKGVEIGAGTSVLPFTVIRRGVKIGQHCEVGPFSHLRVGTVLHDTAEIGNFVECKKAEIGPHTKAKHLTYLGDVTIGENSNIGAGTIICNYDGKNKHATVIGNHVFIGSGSMIVAPRTIADGGRTGAGAVVTKDVPSDTTVVGVPAKPLQKPPRATPS